MKATLCCLGILQRMRALVFLSLDYVLQTGRVSFSAVLPLSLKYKRV